MTVSADMQSILLLTVHFGKQASGAGKRDSEGSKPLRPKDYSRLAQWLKDRSLSPGRLLSGDPQELLRGFQDKKVTPDRVDALLDRGAVLDLLMDRWLGDGRWVMMRFDEDYPRRLKQRLRDIAPPVFFGCGHKAVLNKDSWGLAVVGSRKASDDDLAYSRKIGKRVSNAGFSIVSGGAKGVDEAAMLGAIGAEGTVVGVMANNLLRACKSKKYKPALRGNNLTLISPFNPEAGFHAGNAMERNKYIYCLADAALVVHSGKQEGGTWKGANENLKKKWVPLSVKRTNDTEAGNEELISKSHHPVSDNADAVNIKELFKPSDELPEKVFMLTPQVKRRRPKRKRKRLNIK